MDGDIYDDTAQVKFYNNNKSSEPYVKLNEYVTVLDETNCDTGGIVTRRSLYVTIGVLAFFFLASVIGSAIYHTQHQHPDTTCPAGLAEQKDESNNESTSLLSTTLLPQGMFFKSSYKLTF